MDYYVCIRKAIEKQLRLRQKNFILYPFGEQGLLTKRILNEVFGIREICIIDNYLSALNPDIKDLAYLSKIDCSNCVVLITSNNEDIYDELRKAVRKYVNEANIVDIFKKENEEITYNCDNKIGKYTYGNGLAKNPYVEKIGAFCSINESVDVVPNHSMGYLSTHLFLQFEDYKNYESYKDEMWYFDGVCPRWNPYKMRKVIIGNDVWLGKNVIITNGANIGNGVIAGAGAVITKDVPDYAIVVGVPARILRYRYTKEQIDR